MAPNYNDFSCSPGDYEFSNHFTDDIIPDDERHLDWGKALNTIRHGKKQAADGSADVEFVRDYHGVKVYILAGHTGEVPVVITGWPAVHDPRQAIESGQWTEQELRDIHQFNDGDSLESDFIYP